MCDVLLQDPNHNKMALNNAYQCHFHHGKKNFTLWQSPLWWSRAVPVVYSLLWHIIPTCYRLWLVLYRTSLLLWTLILITTFILYNICYLCYCTVWTSKKNPWLTTFTTPTVPVSSLLNDDLNNPIKAAEKEVSDSISHLERIGVLQP